MINFAYIYALPGLEKPESHHVATKASNFYSVAVDFTNRNQAINVAIELVTKHDVRMIELCGGLANANLVSQVKNAVGDNVMVGQVMYGPEFRRPLVDLLKL